ncbi:MAG: sterol desaturase family protein [Pseudomonadales bacterium]|nr:sterol desaturase family protein [Pseudomonadales bacterium]RZV54305.1 MAG: sterol desaturase family protein [Pseudomonadales bacterium]
MIARFLVFPLTMAAALLTTWAGFAVFNLPHALAAGLSVLVFGFIWVSILERLMPYRKDWNRSDNDVITDFIHLFIDNGIIVTLEKPILVALLVGASAWLIQLAQGTLWPSDWPLLAQLFLMLLIAEFGRYWIHLAAHRVPWLWRLHAVHHSPNRLYLLNAARFHPLEKILFQLPEVVPFILLGTNIETITLYLTFNSVHGLFQHSNVSLRLGPLNYLFSMTELHRWHHSKNPEESDRNFGNNLIVWDILFGTFYYPKNREVGDIGLLSPSYPKNYLGQLKAPFAKRDISKPAGADCRSKVAGEA